MSKRNGKMKYLAIGAIGLIAVSYTHLTGDDK